MMPLQSKSLIFDLYGAFVRELGGWIAIVDLVDLLGTLGVDEQAARSSVWRSARKGLLVREVRHGRPGYLLSGHAEEILREGDRRIYDQMEPPPVADGWVLATFSVPEEARSTRHQLRKRLTWLGFGNVSAGLWIAPRRTLERARALVAELGLDDHVDLFDAHYSGDDVRAFVARCWDIDALQDVYRRYIAEFGSVGERWRGMDPAEQPAAAFADYVAALHTWRKMPYDDPGLPSELLPDDWPGGGARAVFVELRAALEASARDYVKQVVFSS